LLKALIRNPKLFTPPEKDKAPPGWIRGILVLTCTGVSYFHGSNDGQKGMGLIVLILVGVLPGTYALKLNESHDKVHAIAVQAASIADIFAKKAPDPSLDEKAAIAELESFVKSDGVLRARTFEAVAAACRLINQKLQNINSFSDLSDQERRSVRNDIYGVASALEKMDKAGVLTDPAEKKAADAFSADLDSVTKYIPAWVKIAVACALGLGTMVGWKRIVVTVGEKIGKSHLTYGQGAAAELVAAATIKIFDNLGLPVSTTHVLSSGVAGTMAANGSGLQAQTLRNILLAWVLTLPVCIFLGSMLFAFGNFLVFHVLGLH
jgi:PiT family inorganic phosphate transporter